jgi:hypothetical protein
MLASFLISDLDGWTLFFICILFWLVTSVGLALPFHINYILVNWGTKLIVNDSLKTIQIIEKGEILNYDLADIQITRHLLGHYKPGRSKSWTPIPFDYYGYLLLLTKDNKKIYLTSLMLDPFKPPLAVNKTE